MDLDTMSYAYGDTVWTDYYFAKNLQGDVLAVYAASDNTCVAAYTYDAWGNVLTTTGSMASTLGKDNPLRYRGYVYDTETTLYYINSRYYDPSVGRFISADALISTGQGLLGNNMFAYCRNNPVCRIDITGYADEEADLDGETKDDLFPDPMGGGGDGQPPTGTASGSSNGSGYSGYSVGGNNAGSQRYEFKSESDLNAHYEKHNGEFGNAFNSPQEYQDAANYVIENGEYVSSQNAYVKFYGMNGRANYAFVGMDRGHTYITTFHLKHVSQICFG